MLIPIIIGCEVTPTSEKVRGDELIGIYIPNYRAGFAESIELKNGSVYIHYFKSFDNIEYYDTSEWRLEYIYEESTKPLVILYNFIDRYPLDAHAYCTWRSAVLDTMPKGWSPSILKRKGEIYIERIPTMQFYIKQKDRLSADKS